MKLTTRIQDVAEPTIEGNRMTGGQIMVREIHYVIVLADGEPVAQQSFYFRGTRWWVDDLFVTEKHRGTDVIKVLRKATFRAVAERSDEFYSWIDYGVCRPEKVLNDPIKRALGVRVELLREKNIAAKYRYNVSALRPIAATG